MQVIFTSPDEFGNSSNELFRGQSHGFLAREVQINGPTSDLGFEGNIVHRRLLITQTAEKPFGRIQYSIAHAFHSPSYARMHKSSVSA